MIRFTVHNVRLPGGAETIPGRPLLASEPLCGAALRTLRVLFPDAARARVADLGAREGGFAAELARAGFDVVAIESRRGYAEACAFVTDRMHLPNLRAVRDHPRELERHGPFDAVLCAGLLHEQEDPAALLEAIGRATRRAVLLDTHFVTEPPRGHLGLSGVARHEGNLGRWRNGDGRDGGRAFWLEKGHLLAALRAAGFDALYEQYDPVPDLADDDTLARRSRSLFVGVKAPAG